MKQRLSDWASIAEIVGAFAVVISLVILIVQVRSNTAAIQSATNQAVVDSLTLGLRERAMNPEVYSIWIRGQDGQELSNLEERRYSDLSRAALRNFENAYYQYQSGGLNEAQWRAMELALAGMLRTEGFKQLWPRFRPGFNPEFEALVESYLETGP